MNFLLPREDAAKNAGFKTCFYCNKTFNNYRALGGHLKVHQGDKPVRSSNRFHNFIDLTRNPPSSLPISQQSSSPGENNPTPLTRATPPFDFSRMFRSNETNQSSRSRFTGSNPGVAQTQIIMSPDFSHGSGSGATNHHNSLASREFAPAGANAAMSSSALDPSGSVVATGFPVDSSLYLGSNGVRQFNNDESQISQANLLPSSGDDLQSTQGYNLGKIPNPTFSITNLDLGFGSYRLPGLNESIAICAFSPGPPCSSLDKVGQSDERSLLMRREGKRPCLADGSGDADIVNASKKPRTAPAALVEPGNHKKKELSLFRGVDVLGFASETCFGAEEEGPESPDVDLSLHL